MNVCLSRSGLALVFTATLLCAGAQATAAEPSCLDASATAARGEALFREREYLLSATHFSLASTLDCDAGRRDRSLYGYALAMYRLGNLGQVVSATAALEQAASPRVTESARLLRAVATDSTGAGLSGGAQLRLDLWRARADANRFETALARAPQLGLDAAELARLDRQLTASAFPSPFVAGLASAILPGAGQALSGSWQSAAVALVLNAVMVGATAELFAHRLPLAGTAAGLVLSVTYVGNIFSAAKSASLARAAARREYETAMGERLLPEVFAP